MHPTRKTPAHAAATAVAAVLLLSGCGSPTIQPRTDPANDVSEVGTSLAATPAAEASGRAPDRADGDSGRGDQGRGDQGRGDKGPGGGLVSPIRIPLPTADVSGDRIPEAERKLRDLIPTACGDGTQCVGIVAVNDDYPGNDTREDCDFVDHVRGGESGIIEVPRNGNVVLVVRVRCEDVGGSGGTGQEGTGENGTGENGAGENGTGENGTDGPDGTGTSPDPSSAVTE